MHPFEAFLQEHNLETLVVSIRAGVRYSTLWNATRGIPITLDHARKIRNAVFVMTGSAYTGHLSLLEPEQVSDMPTIPIKKITRQYTW